MGHRVVFPVRFLCSLHFFNLTNCLIFRMDSNHRSCREWGKEKSLEVTNSAPRFIPNLNTFNMPYLFVN